jgi:hypothetical protein
MLLAQTFRLRHRPALSSEPRFVRGGGARLQVTLIRGETRVEATLRMVRDRSHGEQLR